MTAQDIRWIHRFNHFTKALEQLTKFIKKGELNELEKRCTGRALKVLTKTAQILT